MTAGQSLLPRSSPALGVSDPLANAYNRQRMPPNQNFYVTTPIYYVNDRPHIGHVYTTTVADIIARHRRLTGHNVFFLTGTDEHAAKVVNSAAERGLSPQAWADENAKAFQDTFTRLGMTHDDFIRTSQDRHKTRVTAYTRQLLDSGDVYAGEYEGWYDAGQEEYVPDNKAKESDLRSPITGQPLVRKREKNYFFKLSKYQDRLLKLIDHENPTFVQPPARRNEVLARISEGLNDVPISRTGTEGWGISMPGDSQQTIYVWIDALFNYLSTVDNDERAQYWPADVHLIAKDILWFHAVIWPCILMALGRPLPKQIYAHSFWIAEGQKMSKSLGNFIDLERIDGYVSDFGLDSLRFFLATDGPLGATDSDFAHARFVEVYNSNLANTLGNCVSRITNMINRYCQGKVPSPDTKAEPNRCHQAAEEFSARYATAMNTLQLADAAAAGIDLVRAIDAYIEQTQPFKLAKDPSRSRDVATVLYNCAEAMRIGSLLLWPILPTKIEQLWQRIGCGDYADALKANRGDFDQWRQWGQMQPGTAISHDDGLFPRQEGSG